MKKENKREHLLKEERFCIEKMKKAGFSSEDIAKTIGRGKSTVDEELRKEGGIAAYDYKTAHHRAYLKQYRKKRTCMKVAMDIGIRQRVEHYLFTYGWSPETISAVLWLEHRLKASSKAIYKYIKKRCLEYLLVRYHKRKGKKRINSGLSDRIFITDPKCVREGYGHWEGDFIVSPTNTSVLLVLVERITRETRIEYLPNRNNDLVNQTVVSMLSDRTVQSITLDNDVAFIKHRTLSLLLAAPVYFTRPYRSTDKALVENTNRWIRQYVPKRSDLSQVSTIQIKKALHWLNERPRECLGWMRASLCARQQEELLLFS
ncbi:MAG: IS30 family transposase [Candidatus Azotimanducaceae bacterium]|jgi:IS30 family transposase